MRLKGFKNGKQKDLLGGYCNNPGKKDSLLSVAGYSIQEVSLMEFLISGLWSLRVEESRVTPVNWYSKLKGKIQYSLKGRCRFILSGTLKMWDNNINFNL